MTALRILLLNGSPNPAGHSMRLARAMLDVFAAVGAKTVVAHLYDLALSPCRGCGHCRKAESGGACPLADAAPGLIRSVATANFVLVASPVHFTSLTAPVVAFFSRLQPFWQAKRRGVRLLPELTRSSALILTAGSERPDIFRAARSAAAAAFNTLAIPFAGMAAAAGTDRTAAADNREALAAAAELAQNMVRTTGKFA